MIDCNEYQFFECMLVYVVIELQTIWTTSNYYSIDANMQKLMQLISKTFIQSLKSKANLDTLFKMSSSEAYQSVKSASHFLQMWMKRYFDMRAEIEKSNAGSRWEFNQIVLFAEVKHLIKIYEDLSMVFDMYIEIENVLGTRIKSLIRQPVEVEQMLQRLDHFKVFFTKFGNDIFRMAFVEFWDELLEEFYGKIEHFEIDVRAFIDRCIELLNSPPDGIILMNFIVGIKTRPSFISHIKQRSDKVMKRLISFIGEVEHEFLKHKKNPPTNCKNLQCFGAIIWCRLLFQKLKNDVLVFRQVINRLSIEFIKTVFALISFQIQFKESENVRMQSFQGHSVQAIFATGF